mmetsp:Transcript_126475/g.269788  ORF Transcript_126475/g.269788 Transcript_126475/m.269788 type:complete len:212 (+) Transcript_126475:44-679(+)
MWRRRAARCRPVRSSLETGRCSSMLELWSCLPAAVLVQAWGQAPLRPAKTASHLRTGISRAVWEAATESSTSLLHLSSLHRLRKALSFPPLLASSTRTLLQSRKPCGKWRPLTLRWHLQQVLLARPRHCPRASPRRSSGTCFGVELTTSPLMESTTAGSCTRILHGTRWLLLQWRTTTRPSVSDSEQSKTPSSLPVSTSALALAESRPRSA